MTHKHDDHEWTYHLDKDNAFNLRQCIECSIYEFLKPLNSTFSIWVRITLPDFIFLKRK